MQAAEWNRKRKELKSKVGALATVLVTTKVFVTSEAVSGDNMPVLLIELTKTGERMLIRAVNSYKDPQIGDRVNLVWRKNGVPKKSKPIVYCLKAQNADC